MTPSEAIDDVCRAFCSNGTHDDACVALTKAINERDAEIDRLEAVCEEWRRKPEQVLRGAVDHLRDCSKRWDGGTLGGFPILRHKWRHALRNGVSLAAMELDHMARNESEDQ